MPLQTGTRIGIYEITGPIGAGAMGEVYQARDTKLQRDVALKVLPESVATDPERVARFAREAKVLASLNHPNIAQIYGVEDGGRLRALALELVPGPTLADRLAPGPLPMGEAIAIARQIADALEAAHEQGIVHRDLKPANIKVRDDDTVKVLDFGLAKALQGDASGAYGADAALSPTTMAHGTLAGTVLGTAAYMAPEQARGRAVDRRADIWAFGAVLYEMLAGRRAFEGADVSDILASVLRSEPAWAALPATTPPAVRRLLARCLEKDPRKRLSAIGDARFDLNDLEPAPTAALAPAGVAPRRSILAVLGPAVAGAVLAGLVAALLWPRVATDTEGLTRLSILAPPGESLFPDSDAVALSPDGTTVAFITGNIASNQELWIRRLNETTAQRLDPDDNPFLPFWSPDSRHLAYFANGKLKTIAATGGRPEVVCDAPSGRGGVWMPSNVIIFSPDAGGPLYRVSAAGGQPTPLTTLDPSRKEFDHRFPARLPDGNHFLYAALPGDNGQFNIYASSLSAPTTRVRIAAMEAAPVYAAPGWLLWARQGTLMAQAFNAHTLTISGDPVTLEDSPASIRDQNSITAARSTAVSDTGTLAYFALPSDNTTAEWYDLLGRKVGTLAVPPGHYEYAAISPDGTHAIFTRSVSPSESSMWLVDLVRGGASPLSSARGRNDNAVWSPDGTQVIFAADRDGPQNLYLKTVGDATPERLLYQSDVLFKSPDSWSRDGKWVVVTQIDPKTQQDIFRLPMPGAARLEPFYASPGIDESEALSPDGHWIYYASDETGRFLSYVQSFPEPGHRVQISPNGGLRGWWTPDGRHLLFVSEDFRTLWRTDVTLGSTFSASAPVQIATLPQNITFLDAMPDRQKFLALSPERTAPGSVMIVQHWLAALPTKH